MKGAENELPIITFNALYNVLKQEERESNLNSLPNNFFEGVDEFILQKKKELKEDSQNIKLQNKFKTAQKIVVKLKKLRAKKITEIAIDSIYDEELTIEMNQKNESNFYSEVKKFFKKSYIN